MSQPPIVGPIAGATVAANAKMEPDRLAAGGSSVMIRVKDIGISARREALQGAQDDHLLEICAQGAGDEKRPEQHPFVIR